MRLSGGLQQREQCLCLCNGFYPVHAASNVTGGRLARISRVETLLDFRSAQGRTQPQGHDDAEVEDAGFAPAQVVRDSHAWTRFGPSFGPPEVKNPLKIC